MSRTKPHRDAEGMIFSQRAAEAVGPYPHARRAGNLLFISGIGPRRRGSKEIPGAVLDTRGKVVSYDIAEQCRSAFENLRFILEDAGTTWERIVDVTVVLTNMYDFAAYNRVYADQFPEVRPARTTVEVTRLPSPIAIEIKAIALID